MPVPYPVFFNIQGVGMDLLKDNVGKLYRKFFIASLIGVPPKILVILS